MILIKFCSSTVIFGNFVYIWPGKLVHSTLNLSTISYSVNGVFNRVASSIHSCKSTTPLKSLSASWNSPVTYLNQNNMKYSITYCKKGKCILSYYRFCPKILNITYSSYLISFLIERLSTFSDMILLHKQFSLAQTQELYCLIFSGRSIDKVTNDTMRLTRY